LENRKIQNRSGTAYLQADRRKTIKSIDPPFSSIRRLPACGSSDKKSRPCEPGQLLHRPQRAVVIVGEICNRAVGTIHREISVARLHPYGLVILDPALIPIHAVTLNPPSCAAPNVLDSIIIPVFEWVIHGVSTGRAAQANQGSAEQEFQVFQFTSLLKVVQKRSNDHEKSDNNFGIQLRESVPVIDNGVLEILIF
jgi:hypothetical protein